MPWEPAITLLFIGGKSQKVSISIYLRVSGTVLLPTGNMDYKQQTLRHQTRRCHADNGVFFQLAGCQPAGRFQTRYARFWCSHKEECQNLECTQILV